MYQKLVIVGNLGGDPEKRYLDSGTAVTNFSVATNRKWTDGQGNRQEESAWFRVTVWGKMAEVCDQYLSKGRQVMVEGRLKADPETGGPRIWTDQNGQPRASYEMTALEVKFLGGRSDSGDSGYDNSSGFSNAAPAAKNAPPTVEEDIPF
jgi:single-strand DNA-binding protein